jgi:hypothetical protein
MIHRRSVALDESLARLFKLSDKLVTPSCSRVAEVQVRYGLIYRRLLGTSFFTAVSRQSFDHGNTSTSDGKRETNDFLVRIPS